MSQDVFNIVKKNYPRTWTVEQVQKLVSVGKLTPDEYVLATQRPIEDLTPSLATIKERKIGELSVVCEETIVSGIDVTTTKGVEHFSLELTDQIEITNQYGKVTQGATEVLYHADGDGGNCRMFSAQEMTDVTIKVAEHVTYHRTYFNEIKAWVNRSTTVDEVNAITYGLALPTDLDEHLVSLVGKSSI